MKFVCVRIKIEMKLRNPTKFFTPKTNSKRKNDSNAQIQNIKRTLIQYGIRMVKQR